jgi:hypothetical protein
VLGEAHHGKTSWDALNEVTARLRGLKLGLSEKQIAGLVVEHPSENSRRPTHVIPRPPSLEKEVTKLPKH